MADQAIYAQYHGAQYVSTLLLSLELATGRGRVVDAGSPQLWRGLLRLVGRRGHSSWRTGRAAIVGQSDRLANPMQGNKINSAEDTCAQATYGVGDRMVVRMSLPAAEFPLVGRIAAGDPILADDDRGREPPGWLEAPGA
ncbi:hypothetical protein GCM10009730_59580 [Streptomyces albidochromogenes]